MPSTTKKVAVERFDREPLSGFVNAQSYQSDAGIELLTQTGAIAVLPWSEVKAVHFVRDFEAGRPALERRMFVTRPRTEGLWVRLIFRDRDMLEGLVANNLLQTEPWGLTVVPPEPSGNTQRLFVPRSALIEATVLGVVGSALRKPRKAKPEDKDQMPLFGGREGIQP